MVSQYLRKVSLVVGQNAGDAIDLSDFRVVFSIKRGDRQTPNTAQILIYNLSDNTAKRIESEFTRVVLQAGYEGNYGIIFDGQIKRARRGRSSPTDTYVAISAADGDSAYQFASLNMTLAAGATAADIVAACTKETAAYGVNLGYTPWGQQTTKPTAADIAAQQARVDAAKKLVDDHMAEWKNLLAQGKQFEGLGDGEAANGNAAAAREYYLKAKASIDRAGSVLTGVKVSDTPAYNAEVAKLEQMKAAAAAPDQPGTAMKGLPRGKVIFSPVRQVLRGIARTTQTVWSIQDGKVQLVPETSYMPGDIPEITSETGLIGLPEQTANGIKFKCLLNPSIKIGSLVHLNNASIQRYEFSLQRTQQINNGRVELQNKLDSDGYYYCMWVDHFGDTRGNDFFSEAICLAVDATVAQEITDKTVAVPESAIKRFG